MMMRRKPVQGREWILERELRGWGGGGCDRRRRAGVGRRRTRLAAGLEETEEREGREEKRRDEERMRTERSMPGPQRRISLNDEDSEGRSELVLQLALFRASLGRRGSLGLDLNWSSLTMIRSIKTMDKWSWKEQENEKDLVPDQCRGCSCRKGT